MLQTEAYLTIVINVSKSFIVQAIGLQILEKYKDAC